jgi:hypothetical protein
MIVLLMNYDVEWVIVGEATIEFQGLDAAFGKPAHPDSRFAIRNL